METYVHVVRISVKSYIFISKGLFLDIMKELFEIKRGILENRKILERIEVKLTRSNNSFVDIEETLKLPCEKQEELEALEAEIQINKNMKDLVCSLYTLIVKIFLFFIAYRSAVST